MMAVPSKHDRPANINLRYRLKLYKQYVKGDEQAAAQ